jgi:hypothetical protein
MQIGIRLAISGLVLASIMVSAIGVHVLWWRTAESNSHALAETINEQIVSAVEKELTTITTEARAAHTAIRTLFVQHVLETREADKREFVFLSQLQSQQNISWVAFGWPDGAFFAAHKLGDLGLEMMEIARVDGAIKRRIDQYQVVVGDIQFEKRRFLRRHRSGMVPERNANRRTALVQCIGSSGGVASIDCLCRSGRRVPETARRSRSHHRIHAARSISLAPLRRKIRRGVHPGARWHHHRRARSGCR